MKVNICSNTEPRGSCSFLLLDSPNPEHLLWAPQTNRHSPSPAHTVDLELMKAPCALLMYSQLLTPPGSRNLTPCLRHKYKFLINEALVFLAAPSLRAQHVPPFSCTHGRRFQTKGINPPAPAERSLGCQTGRRDGWIGE